MASIVTGVALVRAAAACRPDSFSVIKKLERMSCDSDDANDFRETAKAGGSRAQSHPSSLNCQVKEGRILVSERWLGSEVVDQLKSNFKISFW